VNVAGRSAFVTGANRGLGRHLAEQLLARGATVYAGARRPETVDLAGAIPVAIDITDHTSVLAAAAAVSDVSILVNDASTLIGGPLTTAPVRDVRLEMHTNFFGTLDVVRAFLPMLSAAGSGGIVNILSVMSWVTAPEMSGYAAAKSAEWSLTNALRLELAVHGVQVTAVHVGYMDTDMVRHVSAGKSDPAVVASTVLDGFESGEIEILADDVSSSVRTALAGGAAALYSQFINQPSA
jgi:NAD(P)-dependent dehydrogenase (short-subunit alcohol dehydrogenase family)